MPMQQAILIEQVCKSFGEVRAVESLCVEVPSGCIYGFLGPNGAGKTTTLRMIMNIIQPDSGYIKIFGNGKFEHAKSRIGYMPEERGLYRKMTVRKVLAYFGSIKGLTNTELSRRVPVQLEQVGLADWANKKVEDLSRGMHQKLQFAVTIINDPELVILDEPFSGLDPINQDLFKNIIRQMSSDGKTIIFSTHVMHEAEQLCDYILLINKGKQVLNDKLDSIRSRYKTGAVCADVDGETGFIETLPIVRKIEIDGCRLNIVLSKDADPQDLLRELVGRVRVRQFEVKLPSLHEIFVSLVKQDNAKDS